MSKLVVKKSAVKTHPGKLSKHTYSNYGSARTRLRSVSVITLDFRSVTVSLLLSSVLRS